MTHIGVPNSVSKFGGILFTPIWNTAVFWYAAGPLKVRVSLYSQNGSPPPPKPLQKPWFICWHIATAQFSQVSNAFVDTARLVSCLPCSSLWVEISTLTYVTNSSCWPERLSVVYCIHNNSDKTNPQKSEISTKIDVYSYSMAHRYASYSAGVICKGCGVVTFNTQSSIY